MVLPYGFASVPTQEEINALPIIDITSKEAWMPRSHPKCEFDLDQFMSNKWSGMIQGNIHPEYMERWRSQLYTSDNDVVHKTLEATTQLAIIEPRTSTDLPIQHEKRRLFAFKYCRVYDTAYMDIGEPTVCPMHKYKYFLVIVFKKGKFIKVYPLKDPSSSFQAFLEFLKDVGILDKIMYDKAGEFNTDKELHKELICHKIQHHSAEKGHQHQKFAEVGVRDLKNLSSKILNDSDAPDSFWCYAIQLAKTIKNFTASRALKWRTPYEQTLAETPDILVLYQFKLYVKITYTMSGINFPASKNLPGRYLGVAWDTGDMLTYLVKPEGITYKTNKHIELAHSAVHKDNGSNKRVNKMRKPSPPIERVDSIWSDSHDDMSSDGDDDEEIENRPSTIIRVSISKDRDLGDAEMLMDAIQESLVEEIAEEEEEDWEDIDPIPSVFEEDDFDDILQIRKIIGHKNKGSRSRPKPQLLTRWENGEESWVNLREMKKDYPLKTTQYII